MAFLADGGGGTADNGAMIGASMGSIFDSMNSFANSAAAGGFEVSQEGGDALIAVIEEFQGWVDAQSERLMRLTQDRKLGESYGAQTMMPFVQEVATDQQGFITQLKALQQSLNKAKEGIVSAMKNYQETEQAAKSKADGVEV